MIFSRSGSAAPAFAALAAVFASTSLSGIARADEPPAAAPPASAPVAPWPVAPLPIVVPAPGQAAASAPSRDAIPITATCSLGDHTGIPDADAVTAADMLCHELAKRQATNAQHEVRLGKLGARIVITLASRVGNTYDERRTLITSLDEIAIAGPRLAAALSEDRSVESTKNVDNVLTSETRTPRVERGQMGFDGGIFGMTGVGEASGMSSGVYLGLLYRTGNFGLSSQGRAGGIGSGDEKIGTASVDIGTRYYLSTSDFSPYVGGGVSLAYFSLHRRGGDAVGAGFAAFGQLGVEAFRTQHAALTAAIRADVPLFGFHGGGSKDTYVVPLSLNVGLVFR